MLAAAKANFQPERLARRDVLHIEQAALGIIRAGDPTDAELGQTFFQVTLLRGIESLAFDAPIKISMFHSPSLTKKGAPARTRLVTYQGPRVSVRLHRFFQRFNQINLFPAKAAIGFSCAAKVPIGCGPLIYWPVQAQMLANATRRKIH